MSIIEMLNIVFSRYVVVFGGEYGRTKSLSLTALTLLEIMMTGKTKIITNMPVHYPDIKDLVEVIPLIQSSQFDYAKMIKDSIVIHDEMHQDLNARNFMRESNKFITNFSVGFRKDNIKYRGSLQFFDTMEVIMGRMLEMIIIPTYINSYSKNTTEDVKSRLENKDFTVKWKCIDKKAGEEFNIIINLYPFLKMYNTSYKPNRLVIDHQEYMERMMMYPVKSKRLEENNQFHIEENKRLWMEGFNEILEMNKQHDKQNYNRT